ADTKTSLTQLQQFSLWTEPGGRVGAPGLQDSGFVRGVGRVPSPGEDTKGHNENCYNRPQKSCNPSGAFVETACPRASSFLPRAERQPSQYELHSQCNFRHGLNRVMEVIYYETNYYSNRL